jgi:phosphatidylglycerophosphate synthase
MEDVKYVGFSGRVHARIGQWFKRMALASPISANAITVLSFVLWILACVLGLMGHFYTGAVLGIISSLGDGLDGAVARARGEVSAKGGFLDFYADRLGDVIFYIMFAIYFVHDQAVFLGALLNIGTSQFSSMFRNSLKLPLELQQSAQLQRLTKAFPPINFRRGLVACGIFAWPLGSTLALALALWVLALWALGLFILIYVKVWFAEARTE